ncbi:hypothetical protein BDW22DRAFT_1362733 [Trametopsis cervina]|nr:hypothetical protein BDW22DRAFT_1362733 [Trametopsis cervina]
MSTTTLNIQIVNEVTKVLGKRARNDSVMVDVSKPIPFPTSAEIVEALRLRVLELENELSVSKKQKTTKTKESVQTKLDGSASVASGSGARDAKAEAKTIKARSKSLFDQLKKAAKNEKYTGCSRTVKVEDHFSQADFELVFGSSGLLTQPTPDNKPKSNVWIRKYGNQTDFAALFGDAYKVDQLKGSVWSVGNIFVGKGQKLGQTQLEIQQMEVQWSKNTEKAVLKIEIAQNGYGDGSESDDEW